MSEAHPNPLDLLKRARRAELRRALEQLSPQDREKSSAKIAAQLLQWSVVREARTVLSFHPRWDEPDVERVSRALLSRGLRLCLLRYDASTQAYEPRLIASYDEDLEPGLFGVMEPRPHCRIVDWNHLDLVLVPGLGFDSMGGRLGRGKGFFDRLLVKARAWRCGAAFDFQMCDSIPMTSTDVPMDFIVTSHGLVRCGGGADRRVVGK